MYKVFDVAKWFLVKNKRDFDLGYTDEMMSNLKLQKLLYYAQGCVLAITDSPLFDEDIEAWEHRPVIPKVHHSYKQYGSGGISENISTQTVFDSETETILDSVYNEFGQYSAWKLRNMTHEETPWKSTAKNCVIDKEIIKTYFRENYVE